MRRAAACQVDALSTARHVPWIHRHTPASATNRVCRCASPLTPFSSCAVTSANVQRIKLILDKVLLDPRYPEFCQRPKNGSTTDCKLPLSPVNVFYGTEDPALSTAELAVFDDSRVCFRAVCTGSNRGRAAPACARARAP